MKKTGLRIKQLQECKRPGEEHVVSISLKSFR